MKSRIQWKQLSKSFTGAVERCPTFINVYRNRYWTGPEEEWYFTVRKYGRNVVVGNSSYKTRSDASEAAAKFLIVALLVEMDPKRFARLKNEHYTLYWLEPIKLFINRQPVSLVGKIEYDLESVDIAALPTLGLFECVDPNDGKQPTADDGRDKIELTKSLTPDNCLTAGKDSGTRKDSK